MNRTLALVFFVYFPLFTLFAESELDSLMNIGKKQLIEKQSAEAKITFLKALSLEEISQPTKKIGILWNNLGVAEWKLGNYSEGIRAYENALSTYRIIGNDTLIADSYYNLGLVLKGLGNYELAIDNLSNAILLFEKLQNKGKMGKVYDVLGNIHKELKNYDQSVNYHQSALLIYEQNDDLNGASRSLHNLGQIHNELENFIEARIFLFRSYKLKKELGLSLAGNHAQIGKYFEGIHELDSAEYYYRKSLEERRISGNSVKLVTAYLHLGDYFLRKEEYAKSRMFLKQAFILADSLELNQERVDILKSQLQIDQKTGVNGESIERYDQLIDLIEIISGEASRKELARLEVEHETYKKDREIELKGNQLALESSNNKALRYRNAILILGVVIISCAVFMVVFFYWKLRKRKMEVEEKNSQLKERNELIDNLHKELSHRNKNYFQMFSGMLVHDKKGVEDRSVKKMLDKYIQRVEAMSQIQAYLLETSNVSENILLNSYLNDLLENIKLTMSNMEINLIVSFEKVVCSYDLALKLGIVLNELVANAYEHGWHDVEIPMLDVTLKSDANETIELVVKNNGKQFRNIKVSNSSKGIHLMQLILKNISGSLIYEGSNFNGTIATVVIEKRA